MRPLYDDFDEYEFAGSPVQKSIRREQRRQENRYAKRRNQWRRTADYREPDDFDDFDDCEHYSEYGFRH